MYSILLSYACTKIELKTTASVFEGAILNLAQYVQSSSRVTAARILRKKKQWRMSCTTKSNLQVKHIHKLQTNECAFTANMLLQVYKNLNKLCTRRQVSCSWHWNTCHGSHGPLPTALGAWSPERMWHVNVTAMMCSCKASSALTFVHPSSMETLEGPPIPQL